MSSSESIPYKKQYWIVFHRPLCQYTFWVWWILAVLSFAFASEIIATHTFKVQIIYTNRKFSLPNKPLCKIWSLQTRDNYVSTRVDLPFPIFCHFLPPHHLNLLPLLISHLTCFPPWREEPPTGSYLMHNANGHGWWSHDFWNSSRVPIRQQQQTDEDMHINILINCWSFVIICRMWTGDCASK